MRNGKKLGVLAGIALSSLSGCGAGDLGGLSISLDDIGSIVSGKEIDSKKYEERNRAYEEAVLRDTFGVYSGR